MKTNFVDPGGRTLIDVTLASLDDAAAFPPECHICTMSRARRLDLGDKMPRYTRTYPKFNSPRKLINTRTDVSVINPELKSMFPSNA